jgi:hypothetical protein
MVAPASDRLCHQPHPDSRNLYRLRRGGRTQKVIAVEASVRTVFVLVGAVAVIGSPWVAVAGLIAHGAKDLWQHRTGFVNNTRWWPPFCLTVDWVAAAIVAIAITAGVDFG